MLERLHGRALEKLLTNNEIAFKHDYQVQEVGRTFVIFKFYSSVIYYFNQYVVLWEIMSTRIVSPVYRHEQ